MKRIVFCFDGTWNKIDGKNATNVARIAQSASRAHHDGSSQLIYYDEGVGTNATDRWTGGIFGHGLLEKIVRAYHFLVLNYELGDQLYVFGFSRGAFTARSFVGLLRNCGVMSRRSLNHIRAAVDMYLSRDSEASPNSEKARTFRLRHCPNICLPGDIEWRRAVHPDRSTDGLTDLRIEYLGIWDSVGALGIPTHLKPLTWINKKYQFHDTRLSSFVRRARHAVAADEKRRTFAPGMWTNLDDLNENDPGDRRYEQMIFPGVHSAVGGGGPIRGLSDAALDWVLLGARMEGLEFDTDDQSPIYSLQPDHRAQLFNQTGKSRWSLGDTIMGVGIRTRRFPSMDRRAFHVSLIRRFMTPAEQLPELQPYRPESLEEFWETLEEMGSSAELALENLGQQLAADGDERALRAPDSVRTYVIQPGDSLRKIAAAQMQIEEDWQILALHNKNVGLLFEDDELYAGGKLEIPVYAAPPAATAPDS